MDSEGQARASYVVPRYRAGVDPAWYHVLHGTVPGHQIDFIYSPEVPQGALNQTHLAHVARLIKYIEPREQTSFAFAIGNLSRDDIQHEPGHGGLALIFGLRVEGVVDHASRAMPPYAHGLVAVDRSLDQAILLDTIFAFYRRFFEGAATDVAGSFYRSYVHTMESAPAEVESFLREYTDGFTELPRSRRSQLGCEFFATEDTKLHRITIVHAGSEPFDAVADMAATLGSILYRSDVKWTSISNGREVDIPGGVSVRFVPESDAPREGKAPVFRLEDIPKGEAEIAEKLFGARPKAAQAAPRMGWREQAAARKGGEGGKGRVGTLPPGANVLMAMVPPAVSVVAPPANVPEARSPEPVDVDDEAPTRSAGFEAEPSVDVAIDDVAPTLNAGLESEPVASTLVESPPPPPPGATAAPEPARPVKAPAPSDPGRDRAPFQQPLSPVPEARVSAPDDAASLDALPPVKPGKGRWLVLGAIAAALVVGIVVMGSGSGSSGPDPATGNGSASVRPAAVPTGGPSTQASPTSQPGVEPVPSSGSGAARTAAPPPAQGTQSRAASPANPASAPASSGATTSTQTPSASQSTGSGSKNAASRPAPAPTQAPAKQKKMKGTGVLDDDSL